MSAQYDVAVIGAGPGGYVAAIRAAQLGAKVAIIDPREGAGGTCLHVGCIPTKALVQSAWLLDHMKSAERFGVIASNVELDFPRAARNKDKTVDGLVKGVTGLVKANGIDFLHGTAQFVDANTLSIGGDSITFDKAIVATGSSPSRPPIPGIDDSRCVDSTGMLALEQQPRRVVVLGGGVIGCEFASIYASFGSEVTIVEMLPRLIAAEDRDASKALEKEFKRKKVGLQLGARVERLEGAASGVTAHFAKEDGSTGSIEADIVLVSTGRTPNVADLGLEAAGVSYDPRAGIAVNEEMRTNVANIFAIGDVAGKYQLAHTASREGEVAAENALGHAALIDYKAVPRVVYTDPEVAAVGLTEEQAREEYGDEIRVGTFPFAANSRAQIYGDTTGFVKVIYETRWHELLGVVMVGSHVSDMISAGVNALEAESTIETIAHSIQAHPTLAESIKEAGLDALGQVVHMPPKKRPTAAV
ncbi:MAG: dihydrolipoamide dehydrogenase [Thermoleophilia bacterium]|jgi:dihydrolipoamide dehydrogenase|nr:dihydrolipoamide dehydrogenase [Thermoleophilia bacterium]